HNLPSGQGLTSARPCIFWTASEVWRGSHISSDSPSKVTAAQPGGEAWHFNHIQSNVSSGWFYNESVPPGAGATVPKFDPLARQAGKSGEVLGRREPLRLETPHLTPRSRAPLRRFAADNPAHSRIVAQALGVVHILVSGKATKYRLPEQPGQCV